MAEKRPATVDSSDVALGSKNKLPRTEDTSDKHSQNDHSAAESSVNTQDTQEYEMCEPPAQDHSETTREHFGHVNSASSTGENTALTEENVNNHDESKIGVTTEAETSAVKLCDISSISTESAVVSPITLHNFAGTSAKSISTSPITPHDIASTSAECVSASAVTLCKSTSLEGDAVTCRSVFPNADLDFVYNTLAKHRADPNRLAIIIDRLLDGSQSNTPVTLTNIGRGATDEEIQNLPEDELYKDVQKVIEQVKKRKPDMALDVTEAYLMLQQHREDVERVNVATETFLARAQGENSNQNHSFESDTIFNKAAKLSRDFPDIDPSEVYELLEKESSKHTSLETLRKMLSSKDSKKGNSEEVLPSEPQIGLNSSEPDDPFYRDNPVYQDMKKISEVFPHRDQNEIYALVEAHYYKEDRIQVVIDELAMLERGSQSDEDMWNLVPSKQKRLSGTRVTHGSLGDVQPEIDKLRELFPDCDPNYIYQRLEDSKNMHDRVKVIAEDMFERKNYPRLKEVLEKQTKESHRHQLHSLDFTLEDFLEKFPDPEGTFMDEGKEMKENYRNHLWVQLNNEFSEFKQSFIRTVIERHKHHLLPSVKELDATKAELRARGGPSKKLCTLGKVVNLNYPLEPDEYFFYELWYRQNEHVVKDYLKQREEERRAKLAFARKKNELYECPCCFEEECLFEEMSCCADGHLFCKTCVVRSVHAAFGEGKTKFPCLSEKCEQEITVSFLKDLLPAPMFSKILKKMQEEEIRSAGIEDLVDCPFCSFATIMPNRDDRIFKCLNPECLKDSCRLCREPNHVPLKCSEVEKQSETDMRTFIEKRVTEAMLRTCHKCGKRFVKEAGCNKMTCVCGATSCYACRAPDIDYSHFDSNSCYEENARKLHEQEMKEAAEKAKAEYLQKHPEAANVQLKYDPLQHLGGKKGSVDQELSDSDDQYDDEEDDGEEDELDDSDDFDDVEIDDDDIDDVDNDDDIDIDDGGYVDDIDTIDDNGNTSDNDSDTSEDSNTSDENDSDTSEDSNTSDENVIRSATSSHSLFSDFRQPFDDHVEDSDSISYVDDEDYD